MNRVVPHFEIAAAGQPWRTMLRMDTTLPDFYLKNDPDHEDRPGTPKCVPREIDGRVRDILERIPREAVIKACKETGHVSFWLGSGYRYRCFCGEMLYKD